MKIVVIGGTGLIGSKTVAMKLSSTLNEAWARNATICLPLTRCRTNRWTRAAEACFVTNLVRRRVL